MRVVNLLPLVCLAAGAALGQSGDMMRPTGFTITAHVVLEDGSPLPAIPIVQILGSARDSCRLRDSFASGTVQFLVGSWNTIQEGQRGHGCLVSIGLPGYHTFRGMLSGDETVTLKRIGPHEGSSVSIASLSAPAEAQKEYAAGEKALTKGKYPEAEKHLNAAVTLYPQYAPAWSELGRTLQLQDRLDEAAAALNRARQADPNYIKPLVQLTELAVRQERWAEAVALSDQTMALHPVEFPEAYYYRALAEYRLKRIDNAERFAREAIQVDPVGENPESLYLLANILADRGQKEDAITEYKGYLRVAPRGEHAKAAKDEMARLRAGG